MLPTDTLLDTSGADKIIKMCDFGFSKHTFFQKPCASLVGTLVYMAPEIINSNGNTYDGQVCLIWNCLTRYAAHACLDATNMPSPLVGCRRVVKWRDVIYYASGQVSLPYREQ
jgi:serine/threonine protein kinase